MCRVAEERDRAARPPVHHDSGQLVEVEVRSLAQLGEDARYLPAHTAYGLRQHALCRRLVQSPRGARRGSEEEQGAGVGLAASAVQLQRPAWLAVQALLSIQ